MPRSDKPNWVCEECGNSHAIEAANHTLAGEHAEAVALLSGALPVIEVAMTHDLDGSETGFGDAILHEKISNLLQRIREREEKEKEKR